MKLGEIGLAAKDAVPLLKRMTEYQPPKAKPLDEKSNSSKPTLRQMSEAEFYPRIREAAEMALRRIQAVEAERSN